MTFWVISAHLSLDGSSFDFAFSSIRGFTLFSVRLYQSKKH